MNNEEQEVSLASRRIQGKNGAVYDIDRTKVVQRRLWQFVIYLGKKINIDKKRGEDKQSNVLIKEYCKEAQPEDILAQWALVSILNKQKYQVKGFQNLLIEAIEDKKKGKYYQIFKPYKQTLYDQLRYGHKQYTSANFQQNLLIFCQNFSHFLMILHFEISKQNRKNWNKFFLHLAPQDIIISDLNLSSFYFTTFQGVIDFQEDHLRQSNALMKIDDASIEGEKQYYAPQLRSKNICEKSNVWIFGCILFQLLSNGQKLDETAELYTKSDDYILKFVQRRLEYLTYFLLQLQEPQKFQINKWITILSNCLQPDLFKRCDSQALYKNLKNISDRQFKIKNQNSLKREVNISLLYDNSKLMMIAGKISNIFYELALNNKEQDKYIIYIAVRFATQIFFDNYRKGKKKMESFKKVTKVGDTFLLFQDAEKIKTMKEIKNKIVPKIEELMRKEEERASKTNKQDQIQLLKDIKTCFPEHSDPRIYNPYLLFKMFCYNYAKVFCKYSKIGPEIAQILLFIKHIQNIEVLWDRKEEKMQNIDNRAFGQVYQYTKICTEKFDEENCSFIYTHCLSNKEKECLRLSRGESKYRVKE